MVNITLDGQQHVTYHTVSLSVNHENAEAVCGKIKYTPVSTDLLACRTTSHTSAC